MNKQATIDQKFDPSQLKQSHEPPSYSILRPDIFDNRVITNFTFCNSDCFRLLLRFRISNFFQKRLGLKQRPFTLIKFRTMKVDTKMVGTHLVDASAVTGLGKILRASKLDELPQLINVIKGDMSLVGPRPCLSNQHELIEQRKQRGIFEVRPGITGLAQIKGIDMSTPRKLSRYDKIMISNMSIMFYFELLIATVSGQGRGDRVRN